VTRRLWIYAEGQTEELFINRILRNHLALHGVKVERPILAATTREATCQRGGFVNWDAIQFDLRRIFGSDPDPEARFTTLLDVYAMPTTVPGFQQVPGPGRSAAWVDQMEVAWKAYFAEPRFIPYLQRHEFETLVLADRAALASIFPSHAAGIASLVGSLAGFACAEDINDGPSTHPSARLETTIPGYCFRKPDNALFVLQEADLSTVRRACPRFNVWLEGWERWGDTGVSP
jgi:hypothetical protein